MSLTGIVVGFVTFLIIGLLHPLVIKAEYYFGEKCWPCFALTGLLCCIASIMLKSVILSISAGVFAFSLFWSIHELFEQVKRVQKGWYPANPAKVKTYNKQLLSYKTSQYSIKKYGGNIMKTILRICSIICFMAAIPLLIIVDWYLYGYGLLSMFIFISIGLLFDQIIRIFYPPFDVNNITLYKKNKAIKLIALLLFVMSPMVFVYGNRFQDSYGTILLFALVGIGLIMDIFAQKLFPFSKLSEGAKPNV